VDRFRRRFGAPAIVWVRIGNAVNRVLIAWFLPLLPAIDSWKCADRPRCAPFRGGGRRGRDYSAVRHDVARGFAPRHLQDGGATAASHLLRWHRGILALWWQKIYRSPNFPIKGIDTARLPHLPNCANMDRVIGSTAPRLHGSTAPRLHGSSAPRLLAQAAETPTLQTRSSAGRPLFRAVFFLPPFRQTRRGTIARLSSAGGSQPGRARHFSPWLTQEFHQPNP